MQITFNITNDTGIARKAVNVSVENVIARSDEMKFVQRLVEKVEEFAVKYEEK